jgi:hypothetical protein
LGEVDYILVSIIGHFLQGSHELVAEDIGINELSLIVDNFRHTELDVRDIVLCSFEEDRDNVLGDLVLHYEGHYCRERVQTAHSVVISLLVHSVVVYHHWHVLTHYPVLLEILSQ